MAGQTRRQTPVSYTHLDVYKRQPQQTSVRVENVTSLKGLIQEIESQTSYRISYQGNLADNVPVKIAKSTKSVSQLLDEALRGTGITYICLLYTSRCV